MFGKKSDQVRGTDTKSVFEREREGRWAVRGSAGEWLVQKSEYDRDPYAYRFGPTITFVWVDELENADLTGHKEAQQRVAQMPKGCAEAVRIVRQVSAS